jgi:putative glutamine amidotransferase
MRIVSSQDYVEPRDALAQDWGQFMAVALPETSWIPLPNLGQEIKYFVADWNINALILTGGGDIVSKSIREITEYTLITLALQQNWPVFGVCRGMQSLQSYFQGTLCRCDQQQHRAKRHKLSYQLPYEINSQSSRLMHTTVNSFHNQGICESDLSSDFRAFAFSEDGLIEGIVSASGLLLGIMWHPEREPVLTALDRYLVQNLFRKCMIDE